MTPLPQYSTQIINYKGYKISTYSFGTGKSNVLLLPSFPNSGLSFLVPFKDIDLSNFRFITLDFPGWFGNSENAFQDRNFEIGEFINILKEVIAFYKIEFFDILGYSFGGSLAINFGSLIHEQVKRIVLIDPVVNGPLSKDFRSARILNLLQRIVAPLILREFIDYSFKASSLKMQNDDLISQSDYAEFIKIMKSGNSKILLQSADSIFKQDHTSELTLLRDKKILLINSGEKHKLFNRQSDYIKSLNLNLQSLIMHGTHNDFIMKPNAELMMKIQQFLLT